MILRKHRRAYRILILVHEVETYQRQFLDFVARVAAGKTIACVCHNDVDGLSAAVLLHHGYGGRNPFEIVATRKAETAWSSRVQQALRAHGPAAVIACDLSPRDQAVVAGLPNLIIDHHKPEGVSAETTLISGYHQQNAGGDAHATPVPTSGLLAYWCASAIRDISTWRWMAGLSVIADMADAGFEEYREVMSAYSPSVLRECVSLLNAPRRGPTGDAEPALRLLLRAESPKDLVNKKDSDVQELVNARAEVQAELAKARRAAPKFSGPVALIRVNSPCQVHPLIAQQWRTRLPKYIVLAANYGYRTGYVHFSARSAGGQDLIAFLKQNAPPSAGDEFGRGHHQATGGSITTVAWNEFVTALGFGPEMKVAA